MMKFSRNVNTIIRMSCKFRCYALLILCSHSLFCAASKDEDEQKVLLISIDGFRYDFRNRTKTPMLDAIVKKGVTSDYVMNVFPTSTFPNHHSLVTGRYPENHGIIDNTFFDSNTGYIFTGTMGEKRKRFWNQSLPIWTVNEMQGHKSGVIFWPGYRVRFNGQLPSYIPSYKYDIYRENAPNVMNVTSRIDLALSWLKKKDVNFVALYTDAADDVAHNYAPDSNRTENSRKLESAIRSVDKWTNYLFRSIIKEKLTKKLNVILIGDHGHVNTSYRHNIHLDDYFDTKKNVRFIGSFTNVFIWPKAGRTKYIYNKLKHATNKHYKVYLKREIPKEFHVKHNRHTAAILLLPDPGWTVTCDFNDVPYLKGNWERGDHGYTNKESKMHPAFFAYGPVFKRGYRKKVVHTVDMYTLIAHILKIKPRKNDGKFSRVKPLLSEYGANLK